MDHPINIRTSPKTPMPFLEQQMIENFWRMKQEEIDAIENIGEHAISVRQLKNIICAKKVKMMMTFDMPSFLTKVCEIFVQELSFCAWMCANSHYHRIIQHFDIAEAIAYTEKSHHVWWTNQPSTSHQHPFGQYKVSQFVPKSTIYPPFSCIPLSRPHWEQYTLQQLPPRALSSIPNNCNMRITVGSSDKNFISSGGISNVAAQDGDMAFHFPYVPSKPLQLSYSSPIGNSSGLVYAGNSTHGIDPKAIFSVIGGEQQHRGQETTTGHHLNVVDERLDAKVVHTTIVSGDNNNIKWDEIGMANDSVLLEFWKDAMMVEDSMPFPYAASSNDLVSCPSYMVELEGYGDEPYLLDDIVYCTSIGRRHLLMD
ncbi:hypothetical protein BS78_08G059900 [Paspalum vaginatum]|nr:hypothetical protein BS78_08G059900 [Paspalum vaginatum]